MILFVTIHHIIVNKKMWTVASATAAWHSICKKEIMAWMLQGQEACQRAGQRKGTR